MKNLILVRHAKSSWEFNLNDHERPLNKRGFSDADLVSKHLIVDKLNPDIILSSDTVRTKTTASIFLNNLSLKSREIELDHNLYDFTGSKLLEVIKNTSDSINNLMIFGHNHAITAFVNTYGDVFIDNVPTCGVVSIEFNIDKWEDLNKGKTIKTLFPKDLKNK